MNQLPKFPLCSIWITMTNIQKFQEKGRCIFNNVSISYTWSFLPNAYTLEGMLIQIVFCVGH